MSIKRLKKKRAKLREQLRHDEELVDVVKYVSVKQNLESFTGALESAVGKLKSYDDAIDKVTVATLFKLSDSFVNLIETLQLDQSMIVENHVKSTVSELAEESLKTHLQRKESFSYKLSNFFYRIFLHKEMYLTTADIYNDIEKINSIRTTFISDGKVKSPDKVINMTEKKLKANLGRLFSASLKEVSKELTVKQQRQLLDTLKATVKVVNEQDVGLLLPFTFVNANGAEYSLEASCVLNITSSLKTCVTNNLFDMTLTLARAKNELGKVKGYRALDQTHVAIKKGSLSSMEDSVSSIVDCMSKYSDFSKKVK